MNAPAKPRQSAQAVAANMPNRPARRPPIRPGRRAGGINPVTGLASSPIRRRRGRVVHPHLRSGAMATAMAAGSGPTGSRTTARSSWPCTRRSALNRTDRDYQGHRVRAIHQIDAAINQLNPKAAGRNERRLCG